MRIGTASCRAYSQYSHQQNKQCIYLVRCEHYLIIHGALGSMESLVLVLHRKDEDSPTPSTTEGVFRGRWDSQN